MSEWEFLGELCDAAAAACCSTSTTSTSAPTTTASTRGTTSTPFPADRVVQVHLAGHTNLGTHILDTHSGPAIAAVWKLYARLVARTGPVSTLFEWDAEIPPLAAVVREARKARRYRSGALAPLEPMAPELALGGLQRWLQVVIESPGSVKHALRSREAARLVRPEKTGKHVLPSARGLARRRARGHLPGHVPAAAEGGARVRLSRARPLPRPQGVDAPRAELSERPPVAQLHPQRARPARCRSSCGARACRARPSATTSRGSSGR